MSDQETGDYYEQFNKYIEDNNIRFDKPKEVKELLLNEEESRLTLFPIRYPKIWDEYERQKAAMWTAQEIDLSKDYDDWEKKLDDDERHFIKYVLAFFAASDAIVNINLLQRFTNDVQILEAQIAYTFQAMMENIHSEMYSLLIDTYIKDREERDTLFNAIEHIPCIKKKAEWAFKWIESDESFGHRLVAFAVVEGIFFSGSFCSIFWLKSKNLMPGLTSSNEFIARDEGMHCDFACLLYSMLNQKLDQETVYDIIKEAVEIEKEFITESLPCNLIGMNSGLMSQYIEFVADYWVQQLGYAPIYKQTNPFPFMENISLEGKTNFFEGRPTQYQKAGVQNKASVGLMELTDDF